MYLGPVSVVRPQNSILFVGFSKKKKKKAGHCNLVVSNHFLFKDKHTHTYCNCQPFRGCLLSAYLYLKPIFHIQLSG